LSRIVYVSDGRGGRQSSDYLTAGALGFLNHECDIDQLYEAIEAAADGRQYVGLSGNNDSVPLSEMIEGPEVTSVENLLSPREREVLHFTADGLSIKEIAFLTHKSPKTIDACRRRIMHKLNTFSIAGLTKYAIREGLTSL
jgi:DNA-binding NarL/FixJ family response regulator